jgi:plasmid stabilization system protein ParE
MDIIDSTEALLTDNPRSGKQGLVDGTYEYVLSKNYYVVYQLDTDQLSILRVLHSRRQWPPVE